MKFLSCLQRIESLLLFLLFKLFFLLYDVCRGQNLGENFNKALKNHVSFSEGQDGETKYKYKWKYKYKFTCKYKYKYSQLLEM